MSELQRLFDEAVSLINQDKYEAAIANLNILIERNPLVGAAYIQRGRCHWEMRRWDLAEADFKKVLQITPNDPDALWTMGLMDLQIGNFEKGWEGYEHRWDSKAFKSARLKTKLPKWEPDKGYQSVLVWCEQGVGDQILYGSMLSQLKLKTPNVTAIVDARLVKLFQRANKGIKFLSHDAKVKNSEYDSQIPIASLGKYFIKSRDDLNNRVLNNYLKPDDRRTGILCNEMKINDYDFVVGLSWASTAPIVGAHKSISLEELAPLWDVPNIKIMNLQYGKPSFEDIPFAKKTGLKMISPPVNSFYDLDGLASAIDICDVILSVSNANVHIAGAMGKKVIVLDANKLWYWNHRNEDRSLFYPSVHLLSRDYILAPWDKQVEQAVNIIREINGE